MSRVLFVTTARGSGPIEFPMWVREMSRVDVFVLNPHGYELEPTDIPTIRESFVYTAETGIGKDRRPFLVFRAYNEILRRSFRELLRWGDWDALIIDGLVSVAPLIGDRGIDVPRGLSWVVYCERPEDREMLSMSADWFQIGRYIVRAKIRWWHRLLSAKAAEVVREERPKLKTLWDGERSEAAS